MDKIKVLVVDDSVFMRNTISKIIANDEIEVIATAVNGQDAVKKTMELSPDIITMDIEMPVMTGLEALQIIMDEKPTPVLMLSTLTAEGAEETMKALSIGAVDFITKKPAFTEVAGLKDEIIHKITSIANNNDIKVLMRRKNRMIQMRKSVKNEETNPNNTEIGTKLAERVKQKSALNNAVHAAKRPKASDIHLICIGISTGGPPALMEVIKRLPGDLPVCILVAQHMPPFFTKSLAERLNGVTKLTVKEAENGDKILPGYIYIAPGGMQMSVTRRRTICISEEPLTELFKPSVNYLITSVAEVFRNLAVGIIMTGMGHDGKEGIAKLKAAGGYSISQDIESCVVAGMPRTIIDADLADEIHSLKDMADTIASLFGLKAI